MIDGCLTTCPFGHRLRGVEQPVTKGLANAGNAAWLGPADDADIAGQVARAAGPSGSNREYVLKLARALRELNADDPHVFAVEAWLRKLAAA